MALPVKLKVPPRCCPFKGSHPYKFRFPVKITLKPPFNVCWFTTFTKESHFENPRKNTIYYILKA